MGIILVSLPFLLVYLILGILFTLITLALSIAAIAAGLIALPFLLVHAVVLAVYEAIVFGPEKPGDI